MRRLFSFATLLFFASAGILIVSSSSNLSMWAACLLALPVMVWLAGGRRAHPVLLWILGICWLQIVCDIAVGDLEGKTIVNDFGAYGTSAMLYSLCAMLAMAAGMRCAKPISKRLFGKRLPSKAADVPTMGRPIEVSRLVIAYGFAAIASLVLGLSAWIIPGLTQPILAFASIKYAAIYLLAITVFETQQGFGWLLLVAVFTILTGMVSFFADYKEGIFVILIAFATTGQRVSIRTAFLSVLAIGTILWISIVWTLVKEDYRALVSSMTLPEKLNIWQIDTLQMTLTISVD
jgi:hypothetical protein